MVERKRRLSLPKRATPPAVEEFARGADTRATTSSKPQVDPLLRVLRQYADERADLSPDAKPTTGLNLRLNAYQHTLLRFLSQQRDRSLQWTIKHHLVPALEAEVRAELE